jgi:hypothetical protein
VRIRPIEFFGFILADWKSAYQCRLEVALRVLPSPLATPCKDRLRPLHCGDCCWNSTPSLRKDHSVPTRLPTQLVVFLCIATVSLPVCTALAREPPSAPSGPRFEDKTLSIRVVVRSRDQLAAFYLARGFNQAAVDEILSTCFITPIIRNKTFEVLWLDLDEWRFARSDTEISRIKRSYWPPRWEAVQLPRAQRSTFGWTLMPEARDLRLDESVGGNVVIPMQDGPFTLTMHFPTGADRQGPVKTVVFEGLRCASAKH